MERTSPFWWRISGCGWHVFNGWILEKNLARRGIAGLRAQQTDEEFSGIDCQGPIHCSVRLKPFDYKTLAWLGGHQFETEEIEFEAGRFAAALYGPGHGGKEARLIAASLDRLLRTELTFSGYSPIHKKTIEFERVGLLQSIEKTSRKASTIRLAEWLRSHLKTSYVSDMRSNELRTLHGLPLRIYVYLESLDFRAESPHLAPYKELLLDKPMFETWGLTGTRADHCRKAIGRASSTIHDQTRYQFELRRSGSDWQLRCQKGRPSSLERATPERSALQREQVLSDGKRAVVWSQYLDHEIPRLLSRKELFVSLVGPSQKHSIHRSSCPNFHEDASGIDLRECILVGALRLDDLLAWFQLQQIHSYSGCWLCRPATPNHLR